MKAADLAYVALAAGYVLWAVGICGFVGETVVPALAKALRWRRWYRNLMNGEDEMNASKRLTSRSVSKKRKKPENALYIAFSASTRKRKI